jgi:hypothetical protein
MTPHPELELARIEMINSLMRTRTHAIKFGYVMDAEDLQARAEHVQTVLNAVTVYVAAVVEDTAKNSRLDSVRLAADALREVAAFAHDVAGDIIGSMFNAAEDAAENQRES